MAGFFDKLLWVIFCLFEERQMDYVPCQGLVICIGFKSMTITNLKCLRAWDIHNLSFYKQSTCNFEGRHESHPSCVWYFLKWDTLQSLLDGDRRILNVIFWGLSIVVIHGFEFLKTGMWKSPSIEFSSVFLQESYHLEPAYYSALFSFFMPIVS